MEPTIVWTGTEYGVAWNDFRTGEDIYFARLDASGDKIGGDLVVTDPSAEAYGSSLVWTGSGFGVAWGDWRDGSGSNEYAEIYFARLNGAGTVSGRNGGSRML